MKEEKQIRGIMMREVSGEKYRITHGSCKRTDVSHGIMSKKTVFFFVFPAAINTDYPSGFVAGFGDQSSRSKPSP
jgi:hypothetical protein